MWRMWCTACAGHDGLEAVATRVNLCLWCREELAGLKVEPSARRPGLYKYEGIMRGLVLRAKVQADGAALRVLLHLFRARAPVGGYIAVPCPSSMWGRMRGRVDVAAFLAHEVGEVASAPWDLFWRLRKRTRTPSRSANDALVEPGWLRGPWLRRIGPTIRGRSILLVDDVCTTGHTLRSVRTALEEAAPGEIRTITLAQARFD